MQDCGGCKWFQKRKNFNGNSGLCELHDCRTDEDHGHNCPDFKAPKFKRESQSEIREAMKGDG